MKDYNPLFCLEGKKCSVENPTNRTAFSFFYGPYRTQARMRGQKKKKVLAWGREVLAEQQVQADSLERLVHKS